MLLNKLLMKKLEVEAEYRCRRMPMSHVVNDGIIQLDCDKNRMAKT